MKVNEFIAAMETAFSDYTAGMRPLVINYLEERHEQYGDIYLQGLYNVVVRSTKTARPPALAYLIEWHSEAIDEAQKIRKNSPPSNATQIGDANLSAGYGEMCACHNCGRQQKNVTGRCQRCNAPLRQLSEEERVEAENNLRQAEDTLRRLKDNLKRPS